MDQLALRPNAHPRHGTRFAMLACALAGVAFIAWLLPASTRDPANLEWLLANIDAAQHWIGWNFFRHEAWQWPPGRTVSYGLEMGSSIVYADAIPWLAMLGKLLSPMLPADAQYSGAWMLACGGLTGAFAFRAAHIATGRIEAGVFAALFAITSVVFTIRAQGHFALMSHWLVWWALCAYVAPAGRVRHAERLLCLVVACGVHAYLLFLVLAILSADLARRTLVARELTLKRASAFAAIGFATLVVTLWLLGYFAIGATSPDATAYGQYRAPLDTFWHSPSHSLFMPSVRTTAMEGMAYLGFGAIALAVFAAWLARRDIPAFGRRHWPIVGASVVCLGFAITHQVSVEAGTLFTVPLHDRILVKLGMFRASGRFTWLAYYAVMLGAIVACCAHLGRKRAAAVLFAALVLQAIDLTPHYLSLRDYYASTMGESVHAPRLQDPFWDDAAARYGTVLVAPMVHSGAQWVELTTYASRHHRPINYGRFARASWPQFADANQRVAADVKQGRLRPDALYVVVDEKAVPIGPLGAEDFVTRIDGLTVIAPRWFAKP